MKKTIAGVKVNTTKLPTREQLIKAALFTGKMTESDIITEIDSHELYRSAPTTTEQDTEQGEHSEEGQRVDTAKRNGNNKAGNK